MPIRFRLSPLVSAFATLAAALVLAARPAGAAQGALLEKTVDVPRDKAIPVAITYGRATLNTVESINDPNASDVADATAKDPKDVTFLIIRFRYDSDDYMKHKVKLHTILLDEAGGVVADASHSATMDPKVKDDTISFPMKVRTVDWPKATKMKVLATFLD
jgi:hypothetical protein